MNDRSLIATGAVGTVVATICCATPLQSVVLGAIGLSAWQANAAFIAMLLVGATLVGLGLYRRRVAATCRDLPSKKCRQT
jgi:mercuric ion transport protein